MFCTCWRVRISRNKRKTAAKRPRDGGGARPGHNAQPPMYPAQRATHDTQRPDRHGPRPIRRAPTPERRSQTFKFSSSNTRARVRGDACLPETVERRGQRGVSVFPCSRAGVHSAPFVTTPAPSRGPPTGCVDKSLPVPCGFVPPCARAVGACGF